MDERVEEEQAQGTATEPIERVAALDIGKAFAVACLRAPHRRPDRRTQEITRVTATTGAIEELADHLVCQGVQLVVMEATSDYWRLFFYLLEARGLRCWLVNDQIL